MAQTTGSLLRLAARRLAVLNVIVPALFFYVPISMLYGLAAQGTAHDGEQLVLARVESVEADPPGGALVDLSDSFRLTLRMPDGTTRSVDQEVEVRAGDDQRVFTDGVGVRSADERALAATLVKAGIMTTIFGVALYGGWRRFRRVRG